MRGIEQGIGEITDEPGGDSYHHRESWPARLYGVVIAEYGGVIDELAQAPGIRKITSVTTTPPISQLTCSMMMVMGGHEGRLRTAWRSTTPGKGHTLHECGADVRGRP